MPFIPYGPFEVDLDLINKGPVMLVHYLGNDDTGRDLLARLIHGAGTATWIALGVVLLSGLIGIGPSPTPATACTTAPGRALPGRYRRST